MGGVLSKKEQNLAPLFNSQNNAKDNSNELLKLEAMILEAENQKALLINQEKVMASLLTHNFVKNNLTSPQHDIYDISIDIDSFTTLHSKGWEIKTNPKSLQTYNEKKNKNSCVIGVMGNIKKGKSYVLSQLTNEPLPHGYNISTKGLCLRYPTIHKNNIIIMDTPGLDFSPVFSAKNTKEEVEKIMKDKEKIVEFMQKFIILHSNIIICVIGEMTVDDQKKIELIKGLAKINQIVIVVHNLYTLPSLEKIQEYLSKVIISNQQKLQRNTYINLNSKAKDDQQGIIVNKEYYNESYQRGDYSLNIIHVVIGNQYTGAELVFNQGSLAFIKNQIESQTNLSQFPVFQKLKEFIIEQFPYLFGKLITSPDSICIEEDKRIYSTFNLLESQNDKLSTSQIIPRHCYYITKKEVIIRLECFSQVKDVKIKQEVKGLYSVVRISGVKQPIASEGKDTSKPSFNNIMSGPFLIEVKIPVNDAVFAAKNCKVLKKNGYLQFVYPRMTEEISESVTIV